MLNVLTGEVMPLQAEQEGEYTVKFCRDESFKNVVTHENSGLSFSMPPDEPDHGQWKASPGLRARLDTVMKGLLGEKAKDVHIDTYRVCW